MEDILIVTYDHNGPKDMPVLIVTQKRGRSWNVKKCAVGEEAEQIYSLLTTVQRQEEQDG